MTKRDYGIAHQHVDLAGVKDFVEEVKNNSSTLHAGYVFENVLEHLEELIEQNKNLDDTRKEHMFQGIALAQTYIHWPRTFYDLGEKLIGLFNGKTLTPTVCGEIVRICLEEAMDCLNVAKRHCSSKVETGKAPE